MANDHRWWVINPNSPATINSVKDIYKKHYTPATDEMEVRFRSWATIQATAPGWNAVIMYDEKENPPEVLTLKGYMAKIGTIDEETGKEICP